MNRYVFLAIVVISSCASSTEEIKKLELNIIDEFPKPIPLEGDKIETESHGLFKLYYLDFVGDNLVVTTASNENVVGVYDKDGIFLNKFGQIGNGPNEFRNWPEIYDYQIDEDDIIVSNFDMNYLTLDLINLTKSIDNGEIIVEQAYEFPNEAKMISRVFYVDTTNIVGVYSDHLFRGIDKRTGLFALNPNNQKIDVFRLPNLSFNPDNQSDFGYGQHKMNLNTRHIDISSSKKYIAIIMRYAPLLQIYEVMEDEYVLKNSLLLERLKGIHYKIEGFETWEYPQYYLDITSTDDYVYLLKNTNHEKDDQPREISVQVLNWEGEIQRVYNISSVYGIARFTVNEADSIFYGLSYSQDAIYKFDYSSRQ